MTKILFYFSLPIVPLIFSLFILFLSALFYRAQKNLNSLIAANIIFNVFYAGFLSWLQYYVWHAGDATRYFLPPTTSIKYFFQYSFTHFWLRVLLTALCACLFWLLLKFLRKKKENFFAEGEVGLGFLTAFSSGWPGFVIFVPGVFLFTIFISIFRTLFLKEPRTTLGWPFIVASFLAILFGNWLIARLGLGVLRI